MNSSRCAACKHLRRRCPSDCIFSPYFPSNDPRRFAYVHKIYGASNVGKILHDLPVNLRAEAAESLFKEASYRIKYPVYGCVGQITMLHQQIQNAECQLARIRARIAVIQARIINNINNEEEEHQQADYNNINPNFFPSQNDVSNPTSFNYDLLTWFD
ncbi:hypothetical protein ABFS82_11G063000 [Erythranthe guttata]